MSKLQFLYLNTGHIFKVSYHHYTVTHTERPAVQRGAGLRTYLTEVSDGQVHACQLLPHRLCQIETQRASGADSNAQEHSCRHGKAECITLTSNINTTVYVINKNPVQMCFK